VFVALYEFRVKPGLEEQFEQSWRIVTIAFGKLRGSLGSRLHKAQDGTYVAYAQWPSEEQYYTAVALPEDVNAARARMRAACDSLNVLKLMTVQDDLLKQ
jgi:heme-degrading monooxygenase HmoA